MGPGELLLSPTIRPVLDLPPRPPRSLFLLSCSACCHAWLCRKLHCHSLFNRLAHLPLRPTGPGSANQPPALLKERLFPFFSAACRKGGKAAQELGMRSTKRRSCSCRSCGHSDRLARPTGKGAVLTPAAETPPCAAASPFAAQAFAGFCGAGHPHSAPAQAAPDEEPGAEHAALSHTSLGLERPAVSRRCFDGPILLVT